MLLMDAYTQTVLLQKTHMESFPLIKGGTIYKWLGFSQ